MGKRPVVSRLSIFLILVAGLLFYLAYGPRDALAQSGSPYSGDQQGAVIAVIESQLDAFRRDDGPGAYRHAAPNIQSVFSSVDVFMSMVKRGYGILIDPAGVEFLDIRGEGGALYQAVRVIGRDGVRKIAVYEMQRQEDGSWKIAGVYIIEEPKADV